MALDPVTLAPENYEDLVRHFYGLIRGQVAKAHGANPEDVDDLTQDMIVKLIQRDVLSWYDKDKVFETPNGPRTAKFPTLLKSVVRKFLRTPIETRIMKAAREPVRLEQPTATGEMWAEVYAPADPEDYEAEVYVEFEMNRAYRHLATIRVGVDMTMDTVFAAMVHQAQDDGRLVRKRVARLLGVQDSTMTRWAREVFAELESIGFLDPEPWPA
jgi:hypothetical protein